MMKALLVILAIGFYVGSVYQGVAGRWGWSFVDACAVGDNPEFYGPLEIPE